MGQMPPPPCPLLKPDYLPQNLFPVVDFSVLVVCQTNFVSVTANAHEGHLAAKKLSTNSPNNSQQDIRITIIWNY